MIEVRAIGPDNWPLWRRLRRAALADAPYAFGSTLDQWSGAGDTEQRWRGRLDAVPLNLVAILDGQPQGMVSATSPGLGGAVELISLWVAPAARGHGVADVLVGQVVDWCATSHPGSSVVLSVKVDNQYARQLYQRNGFAQAGPSPDAADEILMRR